MRKITDGELVSEIAAKQSGPRARKFEQWPPRSPSIIYKEGVFILVLAGGIRLEHYVVEHSGWPASTLKDTLLIASYWAALAAFIYGVGSLAYAFIRRRTLHARLLEEYEERRAIYSRLRYVAKDNIVFDPVTGKEVSSEHLEGLITFLNREQKSKARNGR